MVMRLSQYVAEHQLKKPFLVQPLIYAYSTYVYRSTSTSPYGFVRKPTSSRTVANERQNGRTELQQAQMLPANLAQNKSSMHISVKNKSKCTYAQTTNGK